MKALFLFLLLIGTARWSAGYTPTPYTEDNCSRDDAIRYDENITYEGMQVNVFEEHEFDLSSEEETKAHFDRMMCFITHVSAWGGDE